MIKKISLILGIAVLLAALGVFAWVTDAPAYLEHAPATCNNCHVMDSQYENWYHAAHADSTACVECHLPHDNLIHYYLAKAQTGAHDVYMFSTGQAPAAIRAKHATDQIIQANCIRCHAATVQDIVSGPQDFDRRCWDCHRSMAHGERGISVVPYQDTTIYPAK